MLDNRLLADRMRSEIESKNLKYKDVADYCGVHPNVVSYWMTYKRVPSINNLYDISELLGVSTDYLLGRKDTAIMNIENLQNEFFVVARSFVNKLKGDCDNGKLG